jgi:hypothetical protein
MASLAVEAGFDLHAASPYFPEQALGLRLDLEWHGVWDSPAAAELALGRVFSELGYSRVERADASTATLQARLVSFGGQWWVETAPTVAARLSKSRPGSSYRVRLTNHADEDTLKGHVRELAEADGVLSVKREKPIAEPGLRRGDLVEAARACWSGFALGESTALETGPVWTYAADPMYRSRELDRVYHVLREAESWEVYTELAPVLLRAQRYEGGEIAVIVDELEDWEKIKAKL